MSVGYDEGMAKAEPVLTAREILFSDFRGHQLESGLKDKTRKKDAAE